MTKLFALAVLGSLVGCGGGGSGKPSDGGGPAATSTTIEGVVFKGPVVGAIVNLYALNDDGSKGGLLGTTTSGTGGLFMMTISPAASGSVLAQAVGGAYLDEVSGAMMNLAKDVLTAVFPADAAMLTFAITPLTHMAAVRAQALAAAGTPLDEAVDQANVGVGQQYNLPSIIGVLPVAPDAPDIARSNLNQRTYGLVLAGISQLAHDLKVRGMDLSMALASDLADGTLDGMKGATPVTLQTLTGTTIPLPATAGTVDLQVAINTFLTSPRNLTNVPLVNISGTPVQVGINGAGVLYTTATVLPAAISGRPYSATLTAKGGKPPYKWALALGGSLPAGFSLDPSGVVLASAMATVLPGGTTLRISPPFTVSVTDASNPPVTRMLELRITTIAALPTIKCLALAAATEGSAYSAPVAEAAGGSPPYYFVSGSFAGGAPPIGLVVEPAGLLSGTPAVGTGGKSYTFPVCTVDLTAAEACCSVTLAVNRAAPAGQTYSLTITIDPPGSGTVTANPDGPLYMIPAGTNVVLTAAPAQGATFTGWSQACSGTGTCTLLMDSDKAATATFKSPTFSGPLNGKGFSKRTNAQGTCTWDDTYSGSIKLETNLNSLSVNGTARVVGQVSSPAGSPSVAGLNCLASSSTFDESNPLSGPRSIIMFSVVLARYGSGAILSGAFTGSLSGNTVTGTLEVSFSGPGAEWDGKASIPVTLNRDP